jgi:hypothetical protein
VLQCAACRDCAQIGGQGWIFAGQLVDIADFDIGRHHARPLGARTKKPTATPNQPCRVERAAGDHELHALTSAQTWSDDDPLGGAVGVQQKHFERITEIIVVELIVADAVKPNRRPLVTMK